MNWAKARCSVRFSLTLPDISGKRQKRLLYFRTIEQERMLGIFFEKTTNKVGRSGAEVINAIPEL